jgi:methylmalonyl-CoA mutase
MKTQTYKPNHPVRFVTATSLFDGHDASINIMRRILQATGAEVIHLGHNRSAGEIVATAIQEDVQGIAVSSYQGGHLEFFKYMVDLLRERGAPHIKIFGGGGGVIVPEEIEELQEYGVERIYSPDDGRRMGLQGIINDMMRRVDFLPPFSFDGEVDRLEERNPLDVARLISFMELNGRRDDERVKKLHEALRRKGKGRRIPVVGITGTGGSGKSSLMDEILRRLLNDFPEASFAILCMDPSKRKTGGALLGDRIRMNSIRDERVFVRSFATRGTAGALSEALVEALEVVRAAGYDVIFVETSGIGQAGTDVVEVADLSIYVMTSEYGAATQLEKIDMIDYADMVVLNKFEKRGAEDALRDVRKQYRRSRELFDGSVRDEDLPVYPTIASQYSDPGIARFYLDLLGRFSRIAERPFETSLGPPDAELRRPSIIPPARSHYLAEITQAVRDYRDWSLEQSHTARRLYRLRGAREELEQNDELDRRIAEVEGGLDPACREMLESWPETERAYREKTFTTRIREKSQTFELYRRSLSGTDIPRIALPRFRDWGDLLDWLLRENLPGRFPYTGGVFPFRREGEDPTRMFAGEGTPERTNRRFHFLADGQPAKRLSTAFDSVTLYGEDPDHRPDIYGKIGNSGVAVCTLDDAKKLYAGFDLTDPKTSVSMTINGPAPMMLAFFLNTAIDQQMDAFREREGREPSEEEADRIREKTLHVVRGTVQADILKEDQAQNTCIFSTEFALRMMGDVQQYFIDHRVRNYYSVSISGYHIAEAGANPITQLALTLANGFTYVEYYLSRGMDIDDFAPNLSFFFSNGLDPEYSVIGRVARRIWAVSMRDKYGGNERSQKLKYHIQTSGRSLHAREIAFNDIRTTLQALLAIYDNCNSLHTNAYDEAVTTPTRESVRRALAIQLIINRELGTTKNDNLLQGSFLLEELTDLVEEAVLAELDRIDSRGGVLGAMESQYQRGKIQEESLYYEQQKESGALPVIGVNTFLGDDGKENVLEAKELTRSSTEEKEQQIRNLRAFQDAHREEAPQALRRLQQTALQGGNVFEELMRTVRTASLGQITHALYDVGGEYRRNM